MEGLERFTPIPALHQSVPLGDDVSHWTTGVTLTKRYAAIHAARRLRAHGRIGSGTIELTPVTDALLDCLALRRRPAQGEKRFRITHDERSAKRRRVSRMPRASSMRRIAGGVAGASARTEHCFRT